MNRQEMINIITHECQTTYGFLANLRFGEFSHAQYETLIHALRLYREEIRGDLYIEREVSGSLYFLDLEMSAAIGYRRSKAEQLAYNQAQIECSELIVEILMPEIPTEPT